MRFQHINNCAKIIKTIHIFDIFLKYRKKTTKSNRHCCEANRLCTLNSYVLMSKSSRSVLLQFILTSNSFYYLRKRIQLRRF